MNPYKKQSLARARRSRVRSKVSGTSEKPRMSVRFTGQHIYVQFIDDLSRKTLVAVGSRDKAIKLQKSGANVHNARLIGQLAAVAAVKVGVSTVVFDKGGARYHGKVRELAEAARSEGLKF